MGSSDRMHSHSSDNPAPRPKEDSVFCVCRFDNVATFPILESQTTAQRPVCITVDSDSAGKFLRISRPAPRAADHSDAIVLALPLVATDGELHQILLDMCGDGSGCSVAIEASDVGGRGLVYSLGRVDFRGWRILHSDIGRPEAVWQAPDSAVPGEPQPPICLHRLRLTWVSYPEASDMGLRALSVTGRPRRAAPGLADANG